MSLSIFVYTFVAFLSLCCISEVISIEKDFDNGSQDLEHESDLTTIAKRRYGDEDFQKRLRYFIGKRSNADKEKRMRYFLGKRFSFDGDVNKRLRYFLGKRDLSENFAGTHSDDTGSNDVVKRMRYFLGKRGTDGSNPDFEKRMRYFLGKRTRYFLGKRANTSELNSDTDKGSSKRMRYFLGKRDRTRYFLGKR